MKRTCHLANIFFYVFIQPNLPLERLLLLVFLGHLRLYGCAEVSGYLLITGLFLQLFTEIILVKCIN